MICLTEPDFLRLPPRPFCIPKPRVPAATPEGAAMAGKLYPPAEMKPKLELLLVPVFTEPPPSAATPINALIANPEGAI
jgi:hypothetical protein